MSIKDKRQELFDENFNCKTLDRKERVRRILNAYGNDPNVILISNHINAGGGEFTYHYII